MLSLEGREISNIDRAKLFVLAGDDAFKVFLEKIVEPEVAKFNTNALNSDMSNRDEAFAKLILAKAAAQVYEGIIQKLNSEIEIYRNAGQAPVPVDTTEGVIDLGEVTKDLPNFFGDVDGGDF